MGMLNVATAKRLGSAPGRSKVVRMGRTRLTIEKDPATDAHVCAFGEHACTPRRRRDMLSMRRFGRAVLR
jgi:hypothetical protein